MSTAIISQSNEAAIRALIYDRVNAVRERNIWGSIALMSPEVLLFDVVGPLQQSGIDDARTRAEGWFASFNGPIKHEIAELKITANDEVGFCHGLGHVKGVKHDGGVLDMWWRVTLCLRKEDGQWVITHEHNSVPFDTETGQASLDLKPKH
jgi:ketosteroid isomerase-like protein